jgi:hypothetical protein
MPEPIPVAEPAPVAIPVVEPLAAEPVPAPAPAPSPNSLLGAAQTDAAPVNFEAPSGPVPAAEPADAKVKAPKKKGGKGGVIAVLIAAGVVMVALIAVGIWIFANGGIGGTVLERIERKDAVESGKKYTIYSEEFNDYIIEARWWDYGDTMDKPGMYNTDTETLAFSIEVNDDAEDDVYYAYYFSKDKEFDKDELSKPLFSDTIPPVEYSNGKIFYDINCSKKIQKGYYVVIVASDDSLKKPYIVAYANVK